MSTLSSSSSSFPSPTILSTTTPSSPIFTPLDINGELLEYSYMMITDYSPFWKASLAGEVPVSLLKLDRKSSKKEIVDSICFFYDSFSFEWFEYTQYYVESHSLNDVLSFIIDNVNSEFSKFICAKSLTRDYILAKANELSSTVKMEQLAEEEFEPVSPFRMYRTVNIIVKAIAFILIKFKESQISARIIT